MGAVGAAMGVACCIFWLGLGLWLGLADLLHVLDGELDLGVNRALVDLGHHEVVHLVRG